LQLLVPDSILFECLAYCIVSIISAHTLSCVQGLWEKKFRFHCLCTVIDFCVWGGISIIFYHFCISSNLSVLDGLSSSCRDEKVTQGSLWRVFFLNNSEQMCAILVHLTMTNTLFFNILVNRQALVIFLLPVVLLELPGWMFVPSRTAVPCFL